MMVGHKKPKVKEEFKHGLRYVLVPIWTKLSEGMECYSTRRGLTSRSMRISCPEATGSWRGGRTRTAGRPLTVNVDFGGFVSSVLNENVGTATLQDGTKVEF